ncbi:DUF6486 family protein [uncultured Bacteroides sp.]
MIAVASAVAGVIGRQTMIF